MDLFALEGYERTSLVQISRRAGCLPGSLFHFFPSKENLLQATLEKRLELLRPEVLAPV
jgi:AcrR family transcriptional regulator